MNRPEWIERIEPDYTGPSGKAYRVADVKALSDGPSAGVGSGWLIFAPQAHPLWAWHLLSGITLKDVEGLPPAHRSYPDAEYELIVMALDPNHPPFDPRAPVAEHVRPLQPLDAVVQFHDVPGGDVGVGQLLELCARACTTGHLVPDSDYRSLWEDSVAATLAHARSGEHGLHPLDPPS